MKRPNAGHSGAMNIDQLQDTAMNVVETFCSVVALPVEIILRPSYGTRYVPVPVTFFSAVLMIVLPVMSAVATSVTQMIPFVHVRAPVGLFGIGSLSKLYFLLSFIHGIRLYRRMIHMELEQNSTFEGPPLFFFRLIPGSNSWWRTRILLEPLVVFVAAIALRRIFIFQSGLATYLEVAAFMLAMKGFCVWYRAWEYLRILIDARFAGPIIARLVENRATEEDLATIHLARLPKNLPPDMREAAVSHIARAFSPEAVGAAHPPTAAQ